MVVFEPKPSVLPLATLTAWSNVTVPPVPEESLAMLDTRVPAGTPGTPLTSTLVPMPVVSATRIRVVVSAPAPMKVKPTRSLLSTETVLTPLSVTVCDVASKLATVKPDATPLTNTPAPTDGTTDASIRKRLVANAVALSKPRKSPLATSSVPPETVTVLPEMLCTVLPVAAPLRVIATPASKPLNPAVSIVTVVVFEPKPSVLPLATLTIWSNAMVPPLPAESLAMLVTRVPAGTPATPLTSVPTAMPVRSATRMRVVETAPAPTNVKPTTAFAATGVARLPLSVSCVPLPPVPVTVSPVDTPFTESVAPTLAIASPIRS